MAGKKKLKKRIKHLKADRKAWRDGYYWWKEACENMRARMEGLQADNSKLKKDLGQE